MKSSFAAHSFSWAALAAILVACKSGDLVLNDRGQGILLVKESLKMPQEQVSEEMRKRLSVLSAFLKPAADPYFGRRELGPTCDLKKLPETRKSTNLQAAYFYATDALVFGSCSDALDRYRAQVLWLYCPGSETLHDIRYFRERHQEWPLEPVARCR